MPRRMPAAPSATPRRLQLHRARTHSGIVDGWQLPVQQVAVGLGGVFSACLRRHTTCSSLRNFSG
eukprot:11583989-Alexandrium_andersonii.AAC.1